MKSFAVIGLGRFGSAIAHYLEEEGAEVLAIEIDPEKVKSASGDFTSIVEADASDIDTLKDIGVDDVDAAVVSIGANMGASILITLLLKELKVPLLIVKAQSSLHGKVLKKIGANHIVYPEKDAALNIARRIMLPGYKELELTPGLCMLEINAPKSFINKTLQELNLRTQYNSNVIAIKKKVPFITESDQTDYKEKIIAPPFADTVIDEGDLIMMVCQEADAEKIKKL